MSPVMEAKHGGSLEQKPTCFWGPESSYNAGIQRVRTQKRMMQLGFIFFFVGASVWQEMRGLLLFQGPLPLHHSKLLPGCGRNAPGAGPGFGLRRRKPLEKPPNLSADNWGLTLTPEVYDISQWLPQSLKNPKSLNLLLIDWLIDVSFRHWTFGVFF